MNINVLSFFGRVIGWALRLFKMPFSFLLWNPITFVLNKIIVYLFSKEKILVKFIKFLDDNIIDRIKNVSPESGKLVEANLVKLLERLKGVILDKE